MQGSPVAVTDETWDAELGQYKGYALVDFWAPWCGPCKMLAPSLEELAREYAGKLKVGKVDVDENGDAAARFAIRSIPCLVLLKDGKEVDRVVGFHNKAQLKAWLDEKMAE